MKNWILILLIFSACKDGTNLSLTPNKVDTLKHSVDSKSLNPFMKKASYSDSIRIVKNLSGKWRYILHYYMPISISANKRIKHPIFNISDTAFIVQDTFISYHYVIEQVINSYYLYEDYNIGHSYLDKNPAYRISISTKHIPVSIHSYNPNYTLETEFLFYKGCIYYDYNGIIFKFKK